MTRLVSCALLVLFCLASARGQAAGPKDPVESLRLMEVEGSLIIGVDGSVQSMELTTAQVQASLRESLIARGMRWRFSPPLVGGRPVQVKTPFRAVLGAVPDGDQFRVRIEGVRFGERGAKDAVRLDGMRGEITARLMLPIYYPPDLARRGRTGGVQLVILLDPAGNVEKVQAVQSMIHDLAGSQTDEAALRTMKAMEVNALNTARRWKFNVPADRAALGPEERTITTQVVYLRDTDYTQPGYWIPVKRGPLRPVPWLPPERTSELAMGAGGASEPEAMDSSLRLLEPAAGTALN